MPIISGGNVIGGARARGYVPMLVAAADAPSDLRAVAAYVCDGTADEVEINAALAAGYEVHLTPGTFTLAATITLLAGRTLRGAGRSATTLALASGANAHAVSASSVANVVVRDLKIDGNSANQASNGRCLNWTSVTDGRIENVHATNSRDNTFNLSSCTRVEFVDCFAESSVNANTGFQLFQSHHCGLLRCRATGHNSCVKFDGANYGSCIAGRFDVLQVGHGAINVKGGSAYCRVIGNFATGMTNGHSGVECYGSYNVIEGNTIEGSALNAATGCGIEISGSGTADANYNVVKGNVIRNVRENAIWLRRESGTTAAITRNLIQGNVLKDDQSSNRASYGIKEDVPADSNYVWDNLIVGFATAALTLQAASDAAKSGNVTS